MKKMIIIGAGILGASTAYHLTKKGANVTIIDRHEAGQATKAAAGIICPWISQRRNKAWYDLAKKGATYYKPLIQELEREGERETGYRQVGALSIHTDQKKLEKLLQRAQKRQEQAPEMGQLLKLSKVETVERFPLIQEEFESVFVEGAARVNGEALCRALLRVAVKNGAKQVAGSATLHVVDGRVTGVRVGQDVILAEQIILTVGAWANEIVKPLQMNLQIHSQKAQLAHFKIRQKETSEWPVLMPPTNQYMLAFPDGKIVAGATHEDNHQFDCTPTVGGLFDVLSKALPIVPELANAQLTEVRVGFRPHTPNFLPIIGQLSSNSNVYLANGLGASGLTVGPFLGQQLAKLVLGEQCEIDLTQYSIEEAIR